MRAKQYIATAASNAVPAIANLKNNVFLQYMDSPDICLNTMLEIPIAPIFR